MTSFNTFLRNKTDPQFIRSLINDPNRKKNIYAFLSSFYESSDKKLSRHNFFLENFKSTQDKKIFNTFMNYGTTFVLTFNKNSSKPYTYKITGFLDEEGDSIKNMFAWYFQEKTFTHTSISTEAGKKYQRFFLVKEVGYFWGIKLFKKIYSEFNYKNGDHGDKYFDFTLKEFRLYDPDNQEKVRIEKNFYDPSEVTDKKMKIGSIRTELRDKRKLINDLYDSDFDNVTLIEKRTQEGFKDGLQIKFYNRSDNINRLNLYKLKELELYKEDKPDGYKILFSENNPFDNKNKISDIKEEDIINSISKITEYKNGFLDGYNISYVPDEKGKRPIRFQKYSNGKFTNDVQYSFYEKSGSILNEFQIGNYSKVYKYTENNLKYTYKHDIAAPSGTFFERQIVRGYIKESEAQYTGILEKYIERSSKDFIQLDLSLLDNNTISDKSNLGIFTPEKYFYYIIIKRTLSSETEYYIAVEKNVIKMEKIFILTSRNIENSRPINNSYIDTAIYNPKNISMFLSPEIPLINFEQNKN